MSKLETLLQKDAYGFLTELVTQFSEIDAAFWNENNPTDEPLTGEGLLGDVGDSIIGYIEETGSTMQVDGYSLREVYSKGGGEGGGESVIRVWAVVKGATRKKPSKHDREYKTMPSLNTDDGEVVAHIRARGFYESYNGTEWDDDAEFVFPQEITVTKYFNKAELKKVKK